MDHERARSLFIEYHDEELADEVRLELEDHLGRCPDCRRDWEAYKQTVAGVSSLGRVKPPRDFVQKIERKIGRRSGGRFFGVKNEFSLSFAVISFVLIVFFLLAYLFIASGGDIRVIERAGDSDAGPGGVTGADTASGESPPEPVRPEEGGTEPQ